jgi:hypothetical protein
LGITITPTVSVSTEEYAGFLSVRPVTDFGTQYERLWQAAKDSFPIACGVVRSSSLLRYNSAHSLTLEVCDRRYGTLVGYASVRRQPPLLYDILARSPATLTPVLAGVLNWLATHGGGGGSDDLRYLNAMETPHPWSHLARARLHARGLQIRLCLCHASPFATYRRHSARTLVHHAVGSWSVSGDGGVCHNDSEGAERAQDPERD